MIALPLSEMVIDGANRLGLPFHPTLASYGLFVGALALAAILRTQKRARAALAVAAVALVGAGPGAFFLVASRPDSLLRAKSSAAHLDAFRTQIEVFARDRGCARVVRSSCVACDPIVRFALAPFEGCRAPASIVLYEDALLADCSRTQDTLSCGTSEGP